MHMMLTGWRETDHRNGNGLDNRRKNLRPCTHAQNCRNAKPRSVSSKYKGVGWSRVHNKWRARIRVDGILKSLGVFTEEAQAARAYDRAAAEYFGEFARLNGVRL